MSLIRALFSGVSGLRNHQIMMDVIGNNISNINTIGFKSSRVTFGELFAQTIRGGSAATDSSGSINPVQVGLGSSINSVDTRFQQGSFETSGGSTDLAIQGNGFFIISKGGRTFFTRVGTFEFDSEGRLVNPGNGGILQGKLADSTGSIPPGTSLRDMRIALDLRSPARATSSVRLAGNLNSAAAIANITLNGNLDPTATPGTQVDITTTVADSFGQNHDVVLRLTNTAANTWDLTTISATNATVSGGTGTLTFDPTTGSISSFSSVVPITLTSTLTPPAPTMTIEPRAISITQRAGASLVTGAFQREADPVNSSVTVFDSLGNKHTLTLSFAKTLNPNEWTWTANVPAPASITGGGSGTITFNPDGSLASFSYAGGATTISIDPANGASPLSIAIDAGTPGVFSGITQTQGASTVSPRSQDGYSSGILSGIEIDQNGILNGRFSNGQAIVLGQIMLAEFSNPGGLLRSGETMYESAATSGLATIVSAGGNSIVRQGTLEQSNVDLTEEFTNMIVAQRGFQANARVITTSDEFLTEVVNLKR
jgi:flagellar hook protein FlgE